MRMNQIYLHVDPSTILRNDILLKRTNMTSHDIEWHINFEENATKFYVPNMHLGSKYANISNSFNQVLWENFF